MPRLMFLHLTTPTRDRPTLCLQWPGGEFMRFELTREQLYLLNADSANALLAGREEQIVKISELQHRLPLNGDGK